MSVGSNTWSDRRAALEYLEPSSSGRPALSRKERLERIHRIRRRTLTLTALESAAWIAGSAAVVGVVLIGALGLR